MTGHVPARRAPQPAAVATLHTAALPKRQNAPPRSGRCAEAVPRTSRGVSDAYDALRSFGARLERLHSKALLCRQSQQLHQRSNGRQVHGTELGSRQRLSITIFRTRIRTQTRKNKASPRTQLSPQRAKQTATEAVLQSCALHAAPLLRPVAAPCTPPSRPTE